MTITYTDPLYGAWPIPDGIANLIATPTMQRLHRVSQSGASKYAHPLKNVTRFQHSLGVYLLLRRLGAGEREQIAGLLHDISHTAFSHVIDIVFYSQEQDLHEGLRESFLDRPDLHAALAGLDLAPADFLSDDRYPLLEQPLPTLCADRIDYSLRDAVAVRRITPAQATLLLDDLAVHQDRIVMQTPQLARQFAGLFQTMNDRYWASHKENYLYETLARAIEIGLDEKIITRADLLTDDDQVETKLKAAGDPAILDLFARLADPPAAELAAFVATRPIKQRAIDPPLLVDGNIVPLSQLSPG